MTPPLNIIDTLALLSFFISGIIGVVRGFTREVLGILGWMGASAAAFFGSAFVRPYAELYIKNSLLAQATGGVVIFVLALALFTLFKSALSSRIKGSALGGVDRSLGLLFGAARAAALIIVTFFGASLLWKPSKWPASIRSAHTTKYAASGILWLHQWLPQTMPKGIDGDQVKETFDSFTRKVAVETLIENLSQPQPAFQNSSSQPSPSSHSFSLPSSLQRSESTAFEPPAKSKLKDGYSKEHIDELNSLLKDM